MWYKKTVLGFLAGNLVLFFTAGPFVTGWVILAEFLVILALALKCYPFFPGGLLAVEAMFLRMIPADAVMREIHGNLEVILLLVFLVPAIFFMKPFLSWLFTKLFLATRSKVLLSLGFLFFGTFLSAWLDALTVMAVMLAVRPTGWVTV